MLQRVAACFGALQSVIVWCNVLPFSVVQCDVVSGSGSQFVAVC